MPPQAYTHVRVIIFRQPSLYTDQKGYPFFGIPPGTIPASNRFTRYSSEESDLTTIPSGSDLDIRMQRFWNAMVTAYDQLKLANALRDTELKVFMAPEFYFRPDNNDTAYTFAEMQAFKRIMTSTLEKDGRFANWQVICGTLVWKQTGVVSGNRPSAPSETGDVYYQTSIVIKITKSGYTKGIEVDKAEPAPIDAIPTDRDSHTYHVSLGRTYRQTRINTMGGIKTGLEICVEHGTDIRELRTMVINDKKKGFDRALDLQLLISAGKYLFIDSAATKVKGYMAQVDGYFNNIWIKQADGMGESILADGINMVQVESYFSPDPNSASPTVYQEDTRSVWSPNISIWKTISIDSNHLLYLPMPSNGNTTWWNERPQKIVIFNKQKLG